MIRRSLLAILVLLSATATTASAATTWLVPGNGSNTCTTVSPNCNTIAQAVTASASGDTISIGAGSFPIASVIALTKTLTITGAGNASTFVQPAAAQTAFSVRTNGIVLSDFTIQNGAIGVAFQSASSNNTQITRVHFSGQTSRGIDISLSASFTVSNVSITDCAIATAGIGLRTSSTAQVSGLAISGTSFTGNTYGIYVANDGSSSTMTGLAISGCTFANNANYGIYAEEMRQSTIEDSTFTGSGTSIILIKFYASNATPVSDIGIRRNTFSGFTANALDLEMRGMGLGTPGITIADNTITKNVGISVSAPAVYVRLHPTLTNGQVDLTNNTITATGTFGSGTAVHGVQLIGNGPIVLTGNVIDGGGVGGSGTTPASSGVYIQSKSSAVTTASTASFTGSCNRIQNFHAGVSVFDTVAGTYGGLDAGATVSFQSNALVGNDQAGAINGASPTLDFENDWWGCVAGPGNPGCDAIVGAVDAAPNAAAVPACVSCGTNAECDDGLFCNGAETCNGSNQCDAGPGDPCAGGDVCGNVCDEAGDTCVVPNGTPCRSVAGPCDVAESCDGVGTSCPADGFAPASTQCGTAAGECDADDFCSGSGPACPDAKQANGTACAGDGNACTLDQCDGVGNACQHPAGNPGATCRGVADVCDVAETCDGVTPACPADDFAPSSTVCRSAAGDCDVAESCTGSSAACPADGFAPDTTPCDDGVTCTIDDVCTAGACSGNSMTCGDGVTQGACGELCDDGNQTSNDGCSATCQPEFVCTPTPLAGCRTSESGKSQLQLKKKTPDTKDQAQWKYGRGGITPKADFGTPLTTTAYQLCIYANGALVSRASIPASGTCANGRPCWKENAKGFQYKDKDATPDGVTQLKLKEGTVAGKSQIQAKLRGANIDFPGLPLAMPVVVQIKNANGTCWETTHGAPAAKNDGVQYRDKND